MVKITDPISHLVSNELIIPFNKINNPAHI